MKRFSYSWSLFIALGLLIGSGFPSVAELPGDAINRGVEAARKGETNKALEEIFNLMLLQQGQIDQLMHRSRNQQELLEQQKQLIEQQKAEINRQKEQLEEQKVQLTESPRLPEGFADNYSADKQFEIAYDIQHMAIFDVRRKESPPYFRKAIEEYRKVVEKYPSADKAQEAQYQIAKLYHRYLKEYAEAIKEYKLLLTLYPESRFADEAQQALSDMK